MQHRFSELCGFLFNPESANEERRSLTAADIQAKSTARPLRH